MFGFVVLVLTLVLVFPCSCSLLAIVSKESHQKDKCLLCLFSHFLPGGMCCAVLCWLLLSYATSNNK